MVISYIYSTCWRMKSTFYECQHSAIMIVVHYAEVSTLYPCVVISSPVGD
jgi:hypothetical protein